jgi:DNA-3-methyladenine glycosylase II
VPSFDTTVVTKAVRHLKQRDPVLSGLIARLGPCDYRPSRKRFRLLVGSIISQQISTAAARSISKRFDALFTGVVTPEKLLRLSDDQIRAAGISPQKLTYLKDLATRVQSGEVSFRRISKLDNDGVIRELIQVKGIGEWTAQMFLMFGLGRLDIMPHGDLGIRSAIRNTYGLEELPDKDECFRIAEPWRPYSTIACLYLWRIIDS